METFKKYQSQVIGVLIVVVIVIVGVVMTKSKNSAEYTDGVNASSTIEEVSMFKPVIVDGVQYGIKGVDFVMAPEAGATQVKLKLVDFMRGASPIEVATFRLGTYTGMCQEMLAAPEDFVAPVGTPTLGFMECVLGDKTTQFVVSQEGPSVVTRVRTLTASGVTAFTKIQSIDLSTLVMK